jgi:hypothetical protein
MSTEVKKLTRKENYNFEYKFSPEELEQKAKQLAKCCQERNGLEDEKKDAMSGFKAKIDSKTAEINLISHHINTGKEFMTKTCDVDMDFDNGRKIYYWEGLKVGEEKMKASDYQKEITDENV